MEKSEIKKDLNIEKYFLFEFIEDNNGKRITSRGDFLTIKDALDSFNEDLRNKSLNSPRLGNYPQAFIIKGIKIHIKIAKKGYIDEGIK